MRRATLTKHYNFITFTVVSWVDVFTRVEYKDFLIKCLMHCQKNKGLEIYAYVIMSYHLHLVVYDTKMPLSNILQDFKSFTSKELFKMIEQNPVESRKDWILKIFRESGKANPLNQYHQFWQN